MTDMKTMNEIEREELKLLRLKTKALGEQITNLKARLETEQTPIDVQELVNKLASVIDTDMPVYVYDLSTDESYPLLLVDSSISDRVELNFDSSLL
jgi:hypothetical protein